MYNHDCYHLLIHYYYCCCYSVVVNPNSVYGKRLKHALDVDDGQGHPGYEDVFWWEDVIFLERNSRTFAKRVARINHNTETLCDYLYHHPKGNVYYYFIPQSY
jgi:cystathionine gamma-synthase